MNNEAIEQAERNIKSAEESLAKAREQLEKAKAPKFRHGDYGRHKPNESPRLFLADNNGTVNAYDQNGSIANVNMQPYEQRDYTILGNIFDDMKKKKK